MIQWRQWALAVCCVLTIGGVRADTVPDLYRVDVAVADQSSAELQRAASVGLRELAVRISGRRDAEHSPALAAAFADAQRYLSQYRFERSAVDGWSAQLQFAPASVEGLLRSARLPVWGADRPVLRAWLVWQDGPMRRFVDDTAPMAAALRAQAQRRGVVLQLPGAASPVRVEDAARRDVAAVRSALAGAGPVLLLGSIEQSDTGFGGRWLIAAGDQQFGADERGDTLDSYLAANIDRLIDVLSAQYAASGSGAQGAVMMVVGIASFEDYAALLKYLQRINLIKRAEPTQVGGDTVQLRLDLQGAPEQLARQFALDNLLVPAEGNAETLSYRWSARAP